ncbi:MAG TPA: hypothetical protein DDW27_11200 [Bacteroidales bacterium]|nr:hypothetical protein [Bacteroidales bacterium]
MKNNFLSSFPWHDVLRKNLAGREIPEFREANGHIHTPYSFSAFDTLETVFRMAREEKIAALGINDFFVTDGFDAFHDGCIRNNIFPLFNIEFIGLLKEEQQKGIRINDPNNPGRIYFSGKGLDYPFSLSRPLKSKMEKVIHESQIQVKAMINRLNELIRPVNPDLNLSYDEIKKRFAMNLVRERHLAKAVRLLAIENYEKSDDQIIFIESLYNGKQSKAVISDQTAMENEIRSNLLKAGGSAFVPENENSFPALKKLIRIINKAGGIPCYPVLLDDPSGKYTEFEADSDKLFKSLTSIGIGCIELIPGRNEFSILKSFCEYFSKRGFVIIFGTEHNTPELAPLTVTARDKKPLDDSLKKIAWEGVCVVAAHQYLRAHGRQGYVLDDGTLSQSQKNDLTELGNYVIEYFLNKNQYEPGN